ncbi:hypothetical protein Tco_0780106 [Tanacetum coccineum]
MMGMVREQVNIPSEKGRAVKSRTHDRLSRRVDRVSSCRHRVNPINIRVPGLLELAPKGGGIGGMVSDMIGS